MRAEKTAMFLALMLWTTSAAGAYHRADGLPVFETNNVAVPACASNLWFEVGEVIQYGMHWGIVSVGRTDVTTQWVRNEEGKTLLLIRFESRSNKILEKIYPISDLQESYVDPETFLPRYYYKKSRQGTRTYDELVTFDHENRKAYWDNYERNDREVVAINEDSRDIITTMYLLRAPGSERSKQETFRVYTDEKIFDMIVSELKREGVKLKRYGKVDSVKYEPKGKFEGLFFRNGRIFMWVSEDPRRICTKLQAKVPLADVRLRLKTVMGPGEDFWVAGDEELKGRKGKKNRHRFR